MQCLSHCCVRYFIGYLRPKTNLTSSSMLADAGYNVICCIILEGGYRALDMQSKGPEFEGAIYMYMCMSQNLLSFFLR